MRQPPKSLFRYRTLTAYSLGELINETMWFSKPSAFNDPFDCALTIDQEKFNKSLAHAISIGQRRGLIPANLPPEKHKPTDEDKAMFLKMRDRLLDVTKDIGLCCFTENARSILMWSHYANHHRGFCIEYSLKEGTLLEQEVSIVKYKQDMASLTLSDLGPDKARDTVEILWRTKAACWKYEKEWRALAPEGNKSYPTRSTVLSIIFGQRMPLNDRLLVKQAVRNNPQIKLMQAIQHESKFAMKIQRCGEA